MDTIPLQVSYWRDKCVTIDPKWYSFKYKSIHDEAVGIRDFDVMLLGVG